MLGYLAPINTHIFPETTLWLHQFLSKIYFCSPCSYPDEGCSLGSLATYPEQWLSTGTILPPWAHFTLPAEIVGCHNLGTGEWHWHLVGKARDAFKPPAIEIEAPYDFD